MMNETSRDASLKRSRRGEKGRTLTYLRCAVSVCRPLPPPKGDYEEMAAAEEEHASPEFISQLQPCPYVHTHTSISLPIHAA
jgi:hypothetical protein